MSGAPIFSSEYAMLDVMQGRKALARHLRKHGPVRVVVTMDIREEFGSDDGTSIEFSADVQAIEIVEEPAAMARVRARGEAA